MTHRKTIDQFMWGYQHHYRRNVQSEADHAFKAIGFDSDPVVFLIGFKIAGQRAYDICVEPETGPYAPEDFALVAERAEELYKANPESSIFHTDTNLRERRDRGLRDRARADAISEVFQTHRADGRRKYFTGHSARIGDYEVHVVLGISSKALTAVPQLQTTLRERFDITPSLVHALIDDILHRAEAALYLPYAGSSYLVLGATSAEIVRTATERFVRTALICAGFWFGQDFDQVLSTVSTLPYEGRDGVGMLVLALADNEAVEVVLRLRQPVDLRQTRAVRKLMEAGGAASELLVAEIDMGAKVYGLGRVRDSYDESTEAVFSVAVMGRGVWDLMHGQTRLLSVRDGVAQLPTHILDMHAFKDAVDRLIPGADEQTLTHIAQIVAKHDHGAMLIVSSDAAGEADRLSPQAWAVEPATLSDEMVRQLTAMDGAILVDANGHCHAIGVILDGQAAGKGDPARGSRYNNAIRYLNSDPPPAVIVVYSADGSIDVLPRLQPRVRRRLVPAVVNRFLKLSSNRPPDFAVVYAAWDRVKNLQFYLSAEQCDDVNRARQEVEQWRRENVGMEVIEADLAPNPDMNDSFWL